MEVEAKGSCNVTFLMNIIPGTASSGSTEVPATGINLDSNRLAERGNGFAG